MLEESYKNSVIDYKKKKKELNYQENLAVILKINLTNFLSIDVEQYFHFHIIQKEFDINQSYYHTLKNVKILNDIFNLNINMSVKNNVLIEEELLEFCIENDNWYNNPILKELMIINGLYKSQQLDNLICKCKDKLDLLLFKLDEIGSLYLCTKLVSMSFLTYLNITNSNLNDYSICQLSNHFQFLPNLEEFWCGIQLFTDIGMKSIAENIHFFTNLTGLGFNSNYNVTNKGFILLFKNFQGIKKLKKLYLEDDQLMDECITEFCKYCNYLPELEVLCISNNYISYTGFSMLGDYLYKCPKLVYLSIHDNRSIFVPIAVFKLKMNHPNSSLHVISEFK